ncbi:MAG: hypothetical protein JW822_05290 [Spirochaetales bacterium]|nr:hypothetical protein [Spirochaetales bacterium]
MKAPNPFLYLLGLIPAIIGGLSLVLFYTGIEFAWIMAAVAIICYFLIFAAACILGRILAMFLLPALLLALIATVIISIFVAPWYMVLVVSFSAVYVFFYLLPVIMDIIRRSREHKPAG